MGGPILPPPSSEQPTGVHRYREAVEPAPRLPPGMLLGGRYELGDRVGRGGMAEVYRARDLVEGTHVAVKVLHPYVADEPEALRRLEREIRLAQAVCHPGVVRVLDSRTAERPPFLVMELVEGRTLRALAAELQTVPEPLLLDLALQIARALAALHAAGAVHRDLKPENLIITPEHEVKIMDLGVAHVVEPAARLTRAHDFIGTPAYAAPEQFQGGAVGPAADLYSLGVTLYEAATGVQPFAAEGLYEVMRRHAEVVPPRPGELGPQLSAFFDELVCTLLEKAPERRLASAAELADVLEAGEASPWWHERERRRRPSRLPTGRRPRVARDTALVGRERALALLGDVYREASGGRGKLLLVEGEAGVGKTRLLDEFLHDLEKRGEDALVLYGSDAPGAIGGRHGALAQGLLAQFGETSLLSALRRYLTVTPRLVAAFAALLTGLPPAAGGELLSPEALHAVFCHLARALAADRPLIWIAEDLHFGSAEGRALLLSLARVCHDQRILLVGTFRPQLPPDEMAGFARLECTRRLALGRLAPAEAARLLRDRLRSDALADDLVDLVAAKSDGVPFFISELVRGLVEAGRLERSADGSYARAGEIAAIDVPESLRELLLGRLRGLREVDRSLLDVAAVQGFHFDPDLVARVLGRKRLEVLQSLAAVERRAGIVCATGSGFRFDHHLLQEVLYAALPPLLRAEYHALLAEGYSIRAGLAAGGAGAALGEDAAFLAQNYLRGGRAVDGLTWALPALRHLRARFRHQELLDLSDLALACRGAVDAALRADLLLERAECLHFLGRRTEQRAAIEQALACAEAARGESRVLRGRCALGALLHHVSEYASARVLLEETLARARAASDPAAEIEVMGLLGGVDEALGEYGAALECCERRLALTQALGDSRAESRAIGSLALVFWKLGRHDQARAQWERQRSICMRIGDPVGEALALSNLGVVASEQANYDQASELLERQLQLSREMGLRQGEAWATGNLGCVFHALGRYGEARTRFDRYLALSREIGFRRGEAIALSNLGQLALDEGRLEKAAEMLAAALELSRALAIRPTEAAVLHAAADLARARSESARARAGYQEALALYRSLGSREGIAVAATALGRQLLELGEREAACLLLEEADELARDLRRAEPGPLPACFLALLGRRDALGVTVTVEAPVALRVEAHVVLYRAGGGTAHLERARALVDGIAARLGGADHAEFRRHSPLARLLAEADDRRF